MAEKVVRLTDAERLSFRKYAMSGIYEPDGTKCQWADYTLRLLDENARLAARVEELGALTHRLDVALESETRMRGDLRAERDRLREFVGGLVIACREALRGECP